MPSRSPYRPRKALFTAAAILAGAYASFRFYNSSCVSRKRKRLARIFNSFYFLGESASQGAATLSILFNDVNGLLQSEGSDVPRSLKQVFKLGQCLEIQETFILLSCALTRGLLRGVKREFEDLTKKGCKEAYRTDAGRKMRRRAMLTNSKFYKQTEIDVDEEYYSRGSPEVNRGIIHGDVMVHKGKWQERNWQIMERLPERLCDKIFSEAGMGFASVVVGSVARNIVIAFFDGLQKLLRDHSEDTGSKIGALISKTSLEFIISDDFRPLLAESIQNFVSTAISVYIDKTKGLNILDEAVAGITNPNYQSPMKELVSTACKESVETLVKTTHEVFFQQRGQELDFQESQKTDDDLLVLESKTQQDSIDLGPSEKHESMLLKFHGHETNNLLPIRNVGTDVGTQCSNRHSTAWIRRAVDDAFTVATNNEKLLINVVGTMASKATKSVCEFMVGIVSSFFGLNARKVWSRITTWKMQSLSWISVFQQELASYLGMVMTI